MAADQRQREPEAGALAGFAPRLQPALVQAGVLSASAVSAAVRIHAGQVMMAQANQALPQGVRDVRFWHCAQKTMLRFTSISASARRSR